MAQTPVLLFLALFLAQDPVENPPKPDRAGATNTGRYDYGVMGPAASPQVVQNALKSVAKPIPAGPFAPTWDSLAANYRNPTWFEDAKFGIFMHWGIFSVPAHHNEWYEKHMYSPAESQWHADHFGSQETFGYKDFIPLFTAAQWDPNAWAVLFQKSGARLVIAMGQHHENFALWDSDVTPFNAKKMGPHRDLVGDLAKAVRAQNLRFGISNHGVENFTFIAPTHDLRVRLESAHADLFDPQWAAFYNVADRSDQALTRFLTNWVDRNDELIDKYRPDMLWFDNGANLRVLDPLKLRIAAYYYNAAKQWNKEVSLGTKYNAYAPSNDDTKQIGSILDFEKVGPRSPTAIRPGPWMVDDSIGSNSWGYIEGLRIASPETIAARLIDTVSKGGFYILNISPMANGIIPDDQQSVLVKLGQWLDANGEAIYGTRPWTQFSDGTWRFTTKAATLYAIASTWPGPEAVIPSLATAKIASVELLGNPAKLPFTQDAQGLKIKMPAAHSPSLAWSFKITRQPGSWSVAKNQHFEIYSQAGPERARATLLHFEQLRAAFSQIPLLGTAQNRILRVVEFTNPQDYESVRVGDAFYTGSEDTDYIVMPIGTPNDPTIAAHEYAHFLLHANGRNFLPWLSEGLAEYCSTIKISANAFQIGGTIPARAQTLQRRNQNERAVFYAESWAVVDMLLARSLLNLSGPAPTQTLLNEARAWVRAGASPVKTIRTPPTDTPAITTEPLPYPTLQFLLADLHSMNADKQGAEALFRPDLGCTDASLCYRYALLSDRLNHPTVEIEQSLAKAVALDPSLDEARFRLAQLKSNTGDYKSAVDHLLALTKIPTAHAYAYWTTLASGLAELGQHKEAIAAANQARHAATDDDQLARAQQLAYRAATKPTVRYTRDPQGKLQLVTARIPYTTTDRNPFIEETDRLQTASGELSEVQCAQGSLTGLLIRTGPATLALSVADPTRVYIRKGSSEWTCGAQTSPAKVAVEFANGQLRGIDFQQ